MYTWDVLNVNENREVMFEELTQMFESRISAGTTEKLPRWEKPHAKTGAWSDDMEGRARKCVERCCELAKEKVEQFFKVSSPCLDDHQSKREELESVGELSQVCSQMVLKCLYLARIGRPDIQWWVNKLSRAVKKWTLACDRRLARLISYIQNEFRQYCYVGNTAQFKTQTLLATLRTQSLPLVKSNVYTKAEQFCPRELDGQEANVCIAQFYRI